MTRTALAPMLALFCGLAACTQQPDALTGEGTEWIAKGSPEAIAAAVAAGPRADGHAAEELAHALGRAMQVAPERVLSLIGTQDLFTAQAICLPQHWDGTPRNRRETIEASRKAIEAVNDPALSKQREACLAEINAATTALDREEEQ